MPRAARFALVLLSTIATVAACAPGKGVADRIRDAGSDLVVDVVYREGDPFFGRPEMVHVYLRHETTDAEAIEFWCSVVVPAGGASLSEGTIDFHRNDQQPGEPVMQTPDVVCPE